jgi:hypothetical protein
MVEQRDLPSSGKSIRNRHGLLFSILSYGQKRACLRPDNPAELTRLPHRAPMHAMFIRELADRQLLHPPVSPDLLEQLHS